MTYENYVRLAKDAAILAGEKIMDIYNASADIGFESKNDNSPLTIADKKSHTTIIDILSKTNINIVKKYLFISSKLKLIFVNSNLFIKIFLGLLNDKI